ncbi:hypothetical protein TNIN_166001 [Trichonephila inaurata madagascariensis]|uniref:Uncharacterized protein n=1 Tax=Trichonephila inaurata madagascariensis TaxID=2747483 RepID=A0A8X6YK51_9ARAC|nr:hypothetical protein TNIN_166001 [Trichonephila inaurata madagascariensis]
MEHCSPIQSFDGVVPDTTLDDQPATTVEELIPIVHCFTVWKICEALNLKVKFVPQPGTTALNSTQRCRSNDYCPCRRIILCVEDLPGVGSSSHLRPTALQNNCFSQAAQTDTSGKVNCCF